MEETKLFREMGHWGNWDEQGENAARRLVESQLMLVVPLAQKHSAAGVPMLELMQEGNIGLMIAVKSFSAKGRLETLVPMRLTCLLNPFTKEYDNFLLFPLRFEPGWGAGHDRLHRGRNQEVFKRIEIAQSV